MECLILISEGGLGAKSLVPFLVKKTRKSNNNIHCFDNFEQQLINKWAFSRFQLCFDCGGGGNIDQHRLITGLPAVLSWQTLISTLLCSDEKFPILLESQPGSYFGYSAHLHRTQVRKCESVFRYIEGGGKGARYTQIVIHTDSL